MASGIFQFAPSSSIELELVQNLHWFKGLAQSSLMGLPTGQAFAAFRESTDPRFTQQAQWLWLRDTVIDAGGKTLTAL